MSPDQGCGPNTLISMRQVESRLRIDSAAPCRLGGPASYCPHHGIQLASLQLQHDPGPHLAIRHHSSPLASCLTGSSFLSSRASSQWLPRGAEPLSTTLDPKPPTAQENPKARAAEAGTVPLRLGMPRRRLMPPVSPALRPMASTLAIRPRYACCQVDTSL